MGLWNCVELMHPQCILHHDMYRLKMFTSREFCSRNCRPSGRPSGSRCVFVVKGLLLIWLSNTLLHCWLRSRDLSGSQNHGPPFMEESDFLQDDEYVGGQPPASPTYPNLDEWTTPPMYGTPFHGQSNGQLTTLLESQKQVLSMLKDMGQSFTANFTQKYGVNGTSVFLVMTHIVDWSDGE